MVTGFDRIFRNEGVTGSNPVSSTKTPWSGPHRCSPQFACWPTIWDEMRHRRATGAPTKPPNDPKTPGHSVLTASFGALAQAPSVPL
jgi:hypothetical protein